LKSAKIYLQHILDSIEKVQRYTAPGKRDFFEKTQVQDAVVRNLEIIGEAVKRLPNAIREQYQDVPWKQAAGMRDELIHEYFGVDYEIVWAVIDQHLPRLKTQIQEILKETDF
jgi:uncharacterized protein with HEPN domain